MARQSKGSKRRALKNDLEFMIDGLTVKVRRWGAIEISGDMMGDRAAFEVRAQRVRQKVIAMAEAGGWPG